MTNQTHNGLKRIKRIPSYSGHARFLAECADEFLGSIARQKDIPSPYASGPTHCVSSWIDAAGKSVPVIIVETSHRRYDVFTVPAEMITDDESATAIYINAQFGQGTMAMPVIPEMAVQS